MNKSISVYITVGEWLFKILLLNIYWFIFSLVGLFVLGLFPATTALFATIRQDIKSEDDVRLFRSFLHYYKQEFLKSNLLGYLMLSLAILLIVNLQVLDIMDSSLLHSSLTIMTYILLAILALISVFIVPIYVHYNFSILGYIKYSAIMVIGKPLQALALLAIIAVLFYLYYLVPGLIPAIGVSLLAYIIMKTAYPSFAIPREMKEES
ncbi:putative membrane protein YesL [Gracilibacillus halotolerans]|uniref:Putative membrane protein YesL n=1 Tax=Gracilibacillus halotolerans TaxID=74386 RepID=A0A841RP85_9BACI|nr:DUF624 domain-containing protein [Gracilibacillus halotolerans]MBB6513682.1 putative membrane protein YesL [Gracilibacillus halotolerans]